MTELQTQLETVIADITAEAFDAFTKDIASAFDAKVTAEKTETAMYSASDIKDKFRLIAGSCTLNSYGTLNGPFHIIFDRPGLLTLASTFLMHPPQTIYHNLKKCTNEKAQDFTAALEKVSQMITSSFDAVFQEKLDKQNQFIQGHTLISKLWDQHNKNEQLNDPPRPPQPSGHANHKLQNDDRPP